MIETIVIIGAGYTGTLSAALLSNLKRKNDQRIYRIVLLDERNSILDGTSKVIDRLHLGGEYPLDQASALSCLQGALYFKQMLPDVYSKAEATNYILAEETEKEGTLTFERMIQNYTTIQQSYSAYFDIFSNLHGKERAIHLLFGHPNTLFSEITDLSYVKGFKKGLVTKEKGINPVILGAFLESYLHENSVEILTNHRVIDAKKTECGFDITTQTGNTTKVLKANQVINASWQNAFSVNQYISPHTNHDELNVFLRCSAVVDITDCPNVNTSYFGMLGKHGGSYSPMNDKIAFIYFPDTSGSYLGECVQNAGNPLFPSLWVDYIKNGIIDKEERGKFILSSLTKCYPFLEKAKILNLFVRPVLSSHKELEKRRYETVKQIDSDGKWISALSMKAVFAPTNALDIVRIIQQNSMNDNFISKNECLIVDTKCDIVLPKEFILSNTRFYHKAFKAYARQYALARQLPIEMVEDEK